MEFYQLQDLFHQGVSWFIVILQDELYRQKIETCSQLLTLYCNEVLNNTQPLQVKCLFFCDIHWNSTNIKKYQNCIRNPWTSRPIRLISVPKPRIEPNLHSFPNLISTNKTRTYLRELFMPPSPNIRRVKLIK